MDLKEYRSTNNLTQKSLANDVEIKRFIDELSHLLLSDSIDDNKAIFNAFKRLSCNQGYEFNLYEKTALKSLIYVLNILCNYKDVIPFLTSIKHNLQDNNWKYLYGNSLKLYAKKYNIRKDDNGVYQFDSDQNNKYREFDNILKEYYWMMEIGYDKMLSLRSFISELA